MTTQTRETLEELQKLLRHGAEKRMGLNPHDNTAHIMHWFANEIANALVADASPLWDDSIRGRGCSDDD